MRQAPDGLYSSWESRAMVLPARRTRRTLSPSLKASMYPRTTLPESNVCVRRRHHRRDRPVAHGASERWSRTRTATAAPHATINNGMITRAIRTAVTFCLWNSASISPGTSAPCPDRAFVVSEASVGRSRSQREVTLTDAPTIRAAKRRLVNCHITSAATVNVTTTTATPITNGCPQGRARTTPVAPKYTVVTV